MTFSGQDDPFKLFDTWFAEAAETEVNDPNAMAVATTDADGLPDVRMILMKHVDARGFVFYGNTGSQKGQQLAAHPRAALCFHWKSLQRQVRVRGAVVPVTAAEADAYFATRPRDSQIGAWASDQSRPLDQRETFEQRIEHWRQHYEGQDVPRPPHWSGYRVVPTFMEFWMQRPYRLHDRFVFTRPAPESEWSCQRLYP